jgi:hypothetical protein
MKKLFLLLLFIVPATVFAQKLNIKALVTDAEAAPLPFATAMILQAKDSSLVTFSRTDDKGALEFKNLNPGNYLLKITFVGFANFFQSIPDGKTGLLELGTLKMQSASKQLQEVTIEGERNAVTIKKDTIEFNASSFKTNKPNASTEDLLKRMPGMEVDRDGAIRVQGESVQRVTVNGKQFFGTDPKLATRNLPADAVESVQVFDRQSDQAAFSGIDDGQREKTINLKIKDKYLTSNFGNATVGAGVDNQNQLRYENKATFNRFTPKTQLSFLGMGNNVNQQGFSPGDFANFSGMTRSGGGGGGGGGGMRFGGGGGGFGGGVPINFGGRQFGFLSNWAGGVNFNRQFNPKTELNGSYFYNHSDQAQDQRVEQENFIPGRSFNSDQQTGSRNLTNSHRGTFILDQRLDSMNSFRLTSNLSYSQTDQAVNSLSETFNAAGSLQNDSRRDTYNATNSLTMTNNLLLRHRFQKRGRTLSANLIFNFSNSNSNGTLEALNQFYLPSGALAQRQPISQVNGQVSDSRTLGANVSYTEPLGKRKYLEVNYNFSNTRNDVDRQVFDLREGGRREFNTNLSNVFNNDFVYHRPGANFRLVRDKWNFNAGFNVQASLLNGQLVLRQTEINRQFTNVLPVLRFNYNFSTTRSIRFEYETSVQEPSITQLQPVVDNTDPLNISVGNPDLRPEYNNRLRFDFRSFNPVSGINFFGLVFANYTQNSIINAVNIDRQFVRTTMPVNVRDRTALTGVLNFGFPVKKLNSRLNVGSRSTYTRLINLLNDQENFTSNYNLGGNVRYQFNYKEWVDLALTGDWTYQQNVFSNAGQPGGTQQQNQTTLNQTYGADVTFGLPWGLRLVNDFDYIIFNNQTTGFRQSIPLWNISLSKFILKDKKGELKFTAVNALDRNIGLSQQVTANFVQQSVINTLGRYFMLSFTYSLNKALNPMNGREGGPGGMMRMMRM